MLSKKQKTIYPSEVQYDEQIGYYYDFDHNIGSDEILVGVYDQSGNWVSGNGVFQKMDSDTIRIFFPNGSEYTWTAYVFYEDGQTADNMPKKRLFEQDTIPASELTNYLSYRLAIGAQGVSTFNITLDQFKAFAQASMDSSIFLLKSNNLSDVLDKDAARNNLDVYSKTVVDQILANTYPVSGFVASVSPFTPTQAFPGITVNPSIDSHGVNFHINFSKQGPFNLANELMGTCDVTGINGIELDIEEDYMPVYMFWNAGVNETPMKLGQVRIYPTAIQDAIRLSFYFSGASMDSHTAVYNCSGILHLSVNREI